MQHHNVTQALQQVGEIYVILSLLVTNINYEKSFNQTLYFF